MNESDVRFTGSVPFNYDRYLVPLLFEPYAEELAARAARVQPKRVLETAAGTGVVTEALARALPEAEIIATDLNQAMLDIAVGRVSSNNVAFREANALELPFEDSSFDLVVSQFGIMFFPDKVRANVEARRVLRNGGRYLVAIWGNLGRNLLCNLAHEVMARLFPDNPPMFMQRGPFSYDDPELVRRDLAAAGFRDVDIEVVELSSRSPSAREAAIGLCYGSPMRVELEEYGEDALERTLDSLIEASRPYEGPNGFETPMSALVVTATK